MNGTSGDMRFERLEAMRVASCCVISRNPEEEVVSYLRKWAEDRGVSGTRAFGFDHPVHDAQKADGLRGYEYWVAVPEHVAGSKGVVIKDIPGDEYAVVRVADPFSDPFERIPKGWEKLRDWVLASEHRPKPGRDRFMLEEVIEGEDGGTYMDLFFPVDRA
jgi:DNA gyrase inhibitor GyrI